MLGSPPGHVKPTSSGHRGDVGAFINTVVPKFTHKIYIIFNWKKSNSNIDSYVSTLRRRANRGGIISQIIFSQTNPCGFCIRCNSNQNKRLHLTKPSVGLFFFPFYFWSSSENKNQLLIMHDLWHFPFSSQLLHIHVKTFLYIYIYIFIPGKRKFHTPWFFCHSSNTPVEL